MTPVDVTPVAVAPVEVAYGAGMDRPVSGRRLVVALLAAAVVLAAAGVALAVAIAG